MQVEQHYKTFCDPPAEFGMMPFWFWNDDLDESEIVRQIREFYSNGIGGFVLHPRMGLSRRIGYLTDEFFRLCRVALAEAGRLGMHVILYDEASYPSGSARGQVVAADPEFAARALVMVDRVIEGPWRGYLRPTVRDGFMERHVCSMLGKEAGPAKIDPSSLQRLNLLDHGLIRVQIPSGTWRVMSFFDMPSGGTIRGAFDDEEDGSATAPPAADLMNPAAVDCFIRLTYEPYYERLKEYFGRTIIAFFTDEPDMLGRGSYYANDPKPYTAGLLGILEEKTDGDPVRQLPALWLDIGDETQAFRRRYAQAVHQRLMDVYYKKLGNWCCNHNIYLTGHPENSDNMASLRRFGWPGQDMVLRLVSPGETALEGEHSVVAKAAASMARIIGARRNATELAGGYGWRLTLDELKWLLDWHMVRGNNLVMPHAFYYSMRGPRAHERPPGLGIHNVWWKKFHLLAEYVRRVCWIITDGEVVCETAIVGDGLHLPWQAAGAMFRSQIDFNYLDDQALAEAKVDNGRLRVGAAKYSAAIIDGAPSISRSSIDTLIRLRDEGGCVVWFGKTPPPSALKDMPVVACEDELVKTLRGRVKLTLRTETPQPNLRYIHYRKEEVDFIFLVNEGEELIDNYLVLSGQGPWEWWDPWTACRYATQMNRDKVRVLLDRRQALMLVSVREKDESLQPLPGSTGSIQWRPIGDVQWQVYSDDNASVNISAPGDWTSSRQFETFAGTVSYRTRFELDQAGPTVLDLGKVGDIAEVRVNGLEAGVRLWAPHRFDIGRLCRQGVNELEVLVTNSMANRYDGAMRPSGLIGPILLGKISQSADVVP